MFNIEDLRNVM